MTRTIHANGIDIAYDLQGPEGAPVVMLSNSLMSNFSMWEGQLPALTPKYRVLRYDQRGHGGTTTTPGPYTIELLTDDAHALAGALGIEHFHYVGLSMGGFSGQMMAFRHPQSVLSLVLCDTACVMPPEDMWNERIGIAETEGIPSLLEGTLGRWLTPPFRESGNAKVERVKAMILGTSAEGYIACCQAIRDMFLCDRLGDIQVPTLIIVGADDPACTVDVAEVLRAGIAGSEFKVINQAAHLPNIEQTAIFNEVLLDFLDRQ